MRERRVLYDVIRQRDLQTGLLSLDANFLHGKQTTVIILLIGKSDSCPQGCGCVYPSQSPKVDQVLSISHVSISVICHVMTPDLVE